MTEEFTDNDKHLMRRAIFESAAAAKAGAMPFGAVLAIDGNEVLAAQNCCICTGVRGGGSDVTRHAEVELVRKACAKLSPDERLKSTLYTSTEPCIMCAGAIHWAGVGSVVYGCSAQQLVEVSGLGGCDVPIRDLYAQAVAPGSRRVSVRGPLLAEEALQAHRESGSWANSPSTSRKEVSEIESERSLLASGIGADASADESAGAVPVINMSLPQEEVAKQLWRAANEVGFFSVTNHGIPQETIDAVFDASAAFFSQTVAEKEAQSPLEKTLNSGYKYMTQVRPSTGTTDQKESLQITARQGSMDGRWPSHPSDFRSVTEDMVRVSHELACRIMTLLESKACQHLKPGTLAKSHTLWEEDGQCTLRLLHYPPMTVEELKSLTKPGKVHWRAGPHTDWDNVTLLFQREGQAGLECRANPRSTDGDNAKWIPVPPVKGGISINIGDMLSRWSDGALYSNLHRVRMPLESECGTSRYSVAFFAQADKSCLIESRQTEPVTAGDYILSRIRSNFSK